jgi:hypothetical protein
MVAATHASPTPNKKSAANSAAAPERSAASPLVPAYQPTERDWYLYEAVQIEGLSSRQAAQRFGISQTRVQQVRRKMTEWLAVIAGPEAGLSPTERIRAAIDLAERRCNFLYSEAMEAWRASQEPQVSTRIGPGGHEMKTTTLKSGDSRYLWMAMRMNTQMLHILGLGKKLLADDPEWTFDAGDPRPTSESQVTGKRARKRPADAEVDAVAESWSPPVGDCSPPGGEQGDLASESAEASDASPKEPTRSEIREARRQAIIAAYNLEIETVQQAEEADRERARGIVAAIYQAEEEERKQAATEEAELDDAVDELDDDDPVDGQDDDLTDAEIAAERQAIQVLRQMDPIEAYQAILACSRSEEIPAAAIPPAAPRQPLNRKERRARQKLLARKLRKAK